MLVLGYIRVSSIEQEQGFGPEIQESAIREYCSANELVEPEIVHESKSGESLLSRHEVKVALNRVEMARESGQEAHLVFYKLDRLARDVLDQETVVGRALSKGFRLHSTFSAEADTLNPAYAGDPMRVAIRQFFGIYNQLERATIQLRLDGGLHLKAKSGASTGGRMPFGYWSLNNEIAVEPTEAAAVRRAFELADRGVDLVGSLSLIVHEFPDLCGHWQKGFLWRVLQRRDLYQHGLYKTRLGVVPTSRPELVIYRPVEGVPVGVPVIREVNWAKVREPVQVLTLSLLCGATESWIKRLVSDRRLAAKWSKGRMQFDKATAQQVAQCWAAEQAQAQDKGSASGHR